MPKVSIVVPIYNMEKYLDECIQSLVKQTYGDIEIILVDDGSSDRCGEMCDAYVANDERIRVIHQKNHGVSVARNEGMAIARGEWISFVDPDDWAEVNMIEELLSSAEKMDADIVMCLEFKSTKTEEKQNTPLFPNDYVLSREDIVDVCTYALFFLHRKRITGINCVTHKLFKKYLLSKNNVTFPIGMKRHQDIIFTLYTFHYAKKIVFIDLPLYHFRITAKNAQKKGLLDDYFFTIGKRFIDEITKFAELLPRQEITDKVILYSIVRTFNSGAVNAFVSDIPASESISYVKETAKREPYVSALKRVRLKDLPSFEDQVPFVLLRLRMYRLYRWMSRVVIRIRYGNRDKDGFE